MINLNEQVHIMVDIETTGLDPAQNGILQIGGVCFDPWRRTISERVFNEALGPLVSRTTSQPRQWDEDTRQWWETDLVRSARLKDLYRRAKDPGYVMTAFREWVLSHVNTPAIEEPMSNRTPPEGHPRFLRRHAVFWAKPAHFDFPFVESYFRGTDVRSPFRYSRVYDVRSFVYGLCGGSPPNEPFLSPTVAHDAEADSIHQIEMVTQAVAAMSNQVHRVY